MAVLAHVLYTCVMDVWDPAVVFAAGTFVVFCTYHVLDHLLLLVSERYQVWKAAHQARSSFNCSTSGCEFSALIGLVNINT